MMQRLQNEFNLFAGLLTAVLIGSHSANAHTGSSAIAYPVSNITVDGDLSDWSADLPVYELQTKTSDAVVDEKDCHANFKVGYDDSNCCLYVAIEVNDDHVVTSGNSDLPPWNAQDSCEVYVDANHFKSGGQHAQFYYRLAYGAYPEVNVDAGTVARSAKENQIIYEWKIDLKKMYAGGACLGLNAVIGFDISIVDHDAADDLNNIHWGSNDSDKWTNPLHLADLLITDQETMFGGINGQVVWKDNLEENKDQFPPISIQSLASPNLRVQISCATDGTYSARVPAGAYTIGALDSVELRVSESAKIQVEVKPESINNAEHLELLAIKKPGLIREKGILHQSGPIKAEQIDHFVKAYMDYHMIPGVSVAVIKDSKIAYFNHFGIKNTVTKEPVKDDTLFEACSMTKCIFAFAVNRLVEKGVLDLDTPLNKYLPNSPQIEDVWNDERLQLITARYVLAHRTGFPNWRGIQKLKIEFTPGTKQGYSGEGFEYLGAVVSHLTGKDLTEVIQDEVFTPLGIENAFLTCDDNIEKQAATGHVGGKNPYPKWMMDKPVMAASLHIDAKNYARFLLGIVERKGLSKPVYDEMLRLQFKVSNPDDETPFGLGIVVEDTPFGKKYSHGGYNSGFKCNFELYDDLKMGYACFTNNEEGDKFCKELNAFLITGETKTEAKQ